jgi:hypothetical protein
MEVSEDSPRPFSATWPQSPGGLTSLPWTQILVLGRVFLGSLCILLKASSGVQSVGHSYSRTLRPWRKVIHSWFPFPSQLIAEVNSK